MATQINVHAVFLFLLSFIHRKFFKPLPMVTFSGKLTGVWTHLSDETLF